jgi:hypothetical protein
MHLLLLLLNLLHDLREVVRRRRLHWGVGDVGLQVVQRQLLADGQQVPVVDVRRRGRVVSTAKAHRGLVVNHLLERVALEVGQLRPVIRDERY